MTQLDRNGRAIAICRMVALRIAAIEAGAHYIVRAFNDTFSRAEAIFGKARG